MAIPVEVPKIGNTVEECLIAKWRKHKGEHVSTGEVVPEIEMDRTRRIHYDRGGHPARRGRDSRL
jgi:pyruvate/2-oxoglutarate dehydrogenase complex dihydrolipoamide acyltransferase (E2) component